MALWFVILLTLFAIGESQSTMSFNQADLQAAMADMRSLSYYGFVILLKILNSQPNSLPKQNAITFAINPKQNTIKTHKHRSNHRLIFI